MTRMDDDLAEKRAWDLRKKNKINTAPTQHDVTCICGSKMTLRHSPKFSRNPWFYGCSRFPKCQATHGCHQGTGKPLGRPADKETKAWRIKAHEAFDALWKKQAWPRTHAYTWMRQCLGLPQEEAHIAMMDIATCKRLIEAVKQLEGGNHEKNL